MTEITLMATSYPHPTNPKIIFWDLPGIGRPNYPDLPTYCEKVNWEKYDTFLIFTRGRFTENDLILAKKIISIDKSFFFIRTHIDVDYNNEKRKKAFKEEEMLKKIRTDCWKNFQGVRHGLNEDKVFLISNHHPTKWDFARLTQSILDVLPFRQRECLTLSLGVQTSPSTDILNRKADVLRELILQEWKYIDESTKHRELFLKLIEYGRNSSVEVKVVGNVRVIFSEEFCIGKGSDGTRVYLGLGKDGYGKAVKQIRRDSYIQLALHEKKILNEFNARKSKYVVNYSFLEEETGTEYVYLILDLCEESLESFVESSTLHDLQKAVPEILRQILQGLADLHSGPNPILHRDLKPTNVLRDSQGKFLIADFGISRMLNNDCTTYESKPNTGTEYWIAPESYCEDKDTVDKGRYKKESDVMNAGMVTYYIATKGKHPFGTKRHRLDNMLNGKPVGLEEIKDEALKDLLSWMLNREPEDRPSATVALKHPFLMSDDEKFDLLCKVGNLQQIKTNDPLCSVVQQLNSESSDWKSKIDSDVYDYFRTDVVTGNIFTYDSSWTECLRLIRNINQHWNDRPRPKPQPEPFYKIGDHKAYILKKFPNLPVRVHATVRSNEELKNNPDLKNFFNFSEKKPHQKQTVFKQ
ncbi:serine/threonine-protein kinase/endoribonuclease IRE1-like [Xenia sp. Carnegie-2017]|uniref:serine/threonine-protein kinase/endoribonuclease IRE1-like n=1 Tax=Xenia sp. Carnegie-2017 TaxID=2897299 RepID=UPI001F0470AB|nr:serine/threonine-protein kinase/endoribonuclease IRE1-like [Xenia sp. Carnegie-2017]